MKILPSIRLVALTVLISQPGRAQSPVVYNAAEATLPQAQCFTTFPGPSTSQLANGEFHVGPTSGLNYISRTDFSIDFDSGFEMEAAFRVVSSGCGAGPTANLRYAIQLSALDDSGSFCAAHFCSTHIALVNTPNSPIDGVNVVAMPYPVAGQTLVARVVVDASQGTLFINGAPMLTVPRGTYSFPAREFYFGDGTQAANAEYYLSYCKASGAGPGCSPTSVVSVTSGCTGLGPLSFTGGLQPGQPVNATFTIPGQGGIPLMLVGSYAMQLPYCAAGCRFGLNPTTAIVVVGNSLNITLPVMSAFTGCPIALQGARIGVAGACSLPLVHALSDTSVMTQ